jgi:hypothetical protein
MTSTLHEDLDASLHMGVTGWGNIQDTFVTMVTPVTNVKGQGQILANPP